VGRAKVLFRGPQPPVIGWGGGGGIGMVVGGHGRSDGGRPNWGGSKVSKNERKKNSKKKKKQTKKKTKKKKKKKKWGQRNYTTIGGLACKKTDKLAHLSNGEKMLFPRWSTLYPGQNSAVGCRSWEKGISSCEGIGPEAR